MGDEFYSVEMLVRKFYLEKYEIPFLMSHPILAYLADEENK